MQIDLEKVIYQQVIRSTLLHFGLYEKTRNLLERIIQNI